MPDNPGLFGLFTQVPKEEVEEKKDKENVKEDKGLFGLFGTPKPKEDDKKNVDKEDKGIFGLMDVFAPKQEEKEEVDGEKPADKGIFGILDAFAPKETAEGEKSDKGIFGVIDTIAPTIKDPGAFIPHNDAGPLGFIEAFMPKENIFDSKKKKRLTVERLPNALRNLGTSTVRLNAKNAYSDDGFFGFLNWVPPLRHTKIAQDIGDDFVSFLAGSLFAYFNQTKTYYNNCCEEYNTPVALCIIVMSLVIQGSVYGFFVMAMPAMAVYKASQRTHKHKHE